MNLKLGEFKDRLGYVVRAFQKREKREEDEGREGWRQEGAVETGSSLGGGRVRRHSMRYSHHGDTHTTIAHIKEIIHQADHDGRYRSSQDLEETEGATSRSISFLPSLPSPPSEKEHVTFTNHTSHSPPTMFSFQT